MKFNNNSSQMSVDKWAFKKISINGEKIEKTRMHIAVRKSIISPAKALWGLVYFLFPFQVQRVRRRSSAAVGHREVIGCEPGPFIFRFRFFFQFFCFFFENFQVKLFPTFGKTEKSKFFSSKSEKNKNSRLKHQKFSKKIQKKLENM